MIDAVKFHNNPEKLIFPYSPIVVFWLACDFLVVFSYQRLLHPFIYLIHKLSGPFRVWKIKNVLNVFILLSESLRLLELQDTIQQRIDFICIKVVHKFHYM